MKKKLLILVDKPGSKKEMLAGVISEYLQPRSEAVLGTFEELYFEIAGKQLALSFRQEDIRNFELVYFRRVGREYYPYAGAVAACLGFLGIKYLDRVFGSYGQLGATQDKLTSYIKLAAAGLPIIPSVFCFRSRIDEYRKIIIDRLGTPLVAKEITLQRGEGVFLARNRAEVRVPKRYKAEDQFLWQQFIRSEEEYRLLVLGGRVGVWERKTRTDPAEFRSNVALGAREEFLPLENLPTDLTQIAVRAAATLDFDIAGVDVMREKDTGNWWLVEVNRGPGLTYDRSVSPELDRMAAYIAGEMGREG